jgi:hypothetical protein
LSLVCADGFCQSAVGTITFSNKTWELGVCDCLSGGDEPNLMSQTMTTLSGQESTWVHEVAGRLRVIQSDTAQVEPARRAEFLQEEVERSLKDVPPANRKRFIGALLERFPVAGKVVSSLSPATSVPTAPAPAPVVAETPEETLERFLTSVSKLPAGERSELIQRLLAADLIREQRSPASLELSEESNRALGLLAGQMPRPERIVQMTLLLLDIFARLDQTALKTMEVLSPRSSLLKRSESVRKAVARYLTGEAEGIEPQMREAFGLVAGLLVAPLSGGRAFGQPYVERFSPAAIEDVVTAEGGGGMFANKKERCWNRYCDLARDFATADLVDRKIKESLASVVQKTVEKSNVGGR